MRHPKELRRHLVLERETVVPSSPVNEYIVRLEPSSGRRISRSMQLIFGTDLGLTQWLLFAHVCYSRLDEYRGRYSSATHLSQASTRKAKKNCIKVHGRRVKTMLDFKLWSEKAQIQ
ncbi:hypothetical protein MKW98_001932 [Papaver atlanticum]|uniref:Uncharacterized protein n=1 Tax=Papaver atlanticum TaxID=357466 RepID=A0AAD4T495_9MAGN|nr:hypothetical protein MKW98_001932 [Papaver atlanticum]